MDTFSSADKPWSRNESFYTLWCKAFTIHYKNKTMGLKVACCKIFMNNNNQSGNFFELFDESATCSSETA